MEMPISSIVYTLLGTEVRIPIYQMELHSTDCRVILSPKTIIPSCYISSHIFYKLEIISPEVFLSASVVPIHTTYSFWKSLVHFRPAGSIEMIRVRILCCGVKTVDRFFHSTLLQFTQLYKWLPGIRQVVYMYTSSFRALIAE